ncbi:hypothetical protein [Bacillus pumilus]|uniref:hypothetical protein n=1 Tax=Bacillus pumilus TaxID=1408 RepID=UPI001E2F3D9C|nr:hypothetical protein [Bacillus pumilus]MCC9090311.1 hypothetical protein [Bacillus pumilus]
MNANIQQLIDQTRMKFGLDHYHLKRHGFYRYVNMFNETIYKLNMEWFPPYETEPEDDDLNPDGTAVIEVNLNTGQVESAVFVMGKTYAKKGVQFDNAHPNEVIKWIEQETNLIYGEHFHLHKEKEGELLFEEKMDDVPVTPSGMIEVKWDEHGQLIYFIHHGPFLAKKMLRAEKYSLFIEMIESLAQQQVQRVEWPSFDQNKIRPVYALEEVYIKNDGTGTIPFEDTIQEHHCFNINKFIEWEVPISEPFVGKELNIQEDISADQAFSCEPSPDTMPISEEEKDKCLKAVQIFLRQEYPNDTGKWILLSLHRDHGYIHATVKANTQEKSVLTGKIMIFIDAYTFEAVNYIDRQQMFKMCGMLDELQSPDKITLSKEEAFEKLREYLELTPIYVFDFAQKQYVLCGKLDCHYGVDAASGEVIPLQDI